VSFVERIKPPDRGRAKELFSILEGELSGALRLYWSIASGILKDSGIKLLDPASGFLSLERNFFSTLFLYSYHRAGIPQPRRVLYAAINQCLRGMVTGCDNLLDDEYKPTLATDLPVTGIRFRSVLDIMISDRVLFEILLREFREDPRDAALISAASCASLRTLARSGTQEASEEGGVGEILDPQTILHSIHPQKTGLLFQSPWAVPELMERNLCETDLSSIKDALCRIGMGCQIMDDMVDLATDIQGRRHNYILSLIHHGTDPQERIRLQKAIDLGIRADSRDDFILEFPQALRSSAQAAQNYLEEGLLALFAEEYRFLLPPVLEMLAGLIGADRFMLQGGRLC